MFIKDLYHDEIRDGWLVMSDNKKVWNRQLEIWAEVDRLCRKHNITYWAAWGTLLGAVRHKGFIPWDDDIDLCMMRPDYNRFLSVLDELNAPFEFKEKSFGMVRISHSQTTFINHTYLEGKAQGFVVEIFALDIANDKTSQGFSASVALDELFTAACNYPKIVRHVRNGGCLVNDLQVLEAISKTSDDKKLELFAFYATALWKQSSVVAWIQDPLKEKPFKKTCFRETIRLPFEMVEMPVPVGYDEILTTYYGDWRTPVNDGKHRLGYVHSADIPWREFLKHFDVKIDAKPLTTGNDVFVTITARTFRGVNS